MTAGCPGMMINHCPAHQLPVLSPLLCCYPLCSVGETATDRWRSARQWVVLVRSERPRWYLACRVVAVVVAQTLRAQGLVAAWISSWIGRDSSTSCHFIHCSPGPSNRRCSMKLYLVGSRPVQAVKPRFRSAVLNSCYALYELSFFDCRAITAALTHPIFICYR